VRDDPSSKPTVLIVDDEEALADLYAMWLEDTCAVRTAYDGEAALDAIDETVDIILLDRRMPGLSGDQVLSELRCRGYDCPVAMVTAVAADLELADIGFDDYIQKPVNKDGLTNVIETLRRRALHSDKIERYTSLLSRKALLNRQVSVAKRESNDAYRKLQSDVDQARDVVDGSLDPVCESDDIDGLFRDIDPSEHV
jgi:DNA-binding response OmpR family regulator